MYFEFKKVNIIKNDLVMSQMSTKKTVMGKAGLPFSNRTLENNKHACLSFA